MTIDDVQRLPATGKQLVLLYNSHDTTMTLIEPFRRFLEETVEERETEQDGTEDPKAVSMGIRHVLMDPSGLARY